MRLRTPLPHHNFLLLFFLNLILLNDGLPCADAPESPPNQPTSVASLFVQAHRAPGRIYPWGFSGSGTWVPGSAYFRSVWVAIWDCAPLLTAMRVP